MLFSLKKLLQTAGATIVLASFFNPSAAWTQEAIPSTNVEPLETANGMSQNLRGLEGRNASEWPWQVGGGTEMPSDVNPYESSEENTFWEQLLPPSILQLLFPDGSQYQEPDWQKFNQGDTAEPGSIHIQVPVAHPN